MEVLGPRTVQSDTLLDVAREWVTGNIKLLKHLHGSQCTFVVCHMLEGGIYPATISASTEHGSYTQIAQRFRGATKFRNDDPLQRFAVIMMPDGGTIDDLFALTGTYDQVDVAQQLTMLKNL